MKTVENLEDFYKRKFDFIPENLRREIGHFNVFKLDDFTGKNAKPVPYKRRDFYKIMLVVGGSKVHYADTYMSTISIVRSRKPPKGPLPKSLPNAF